MAERFILALDQGTTSSRAIIFNHQGQAVAVAQQEFPQYYPQPGWVEHNATEIWATQLAVAQEVLQKAGLTAADIAAIGVTNQRETTVLWDKATGQPVHPAIVWQCRRSAAICHDLREQKYESLFRQKTGLVLDAYFSGTKLKWIFDQHPDLKARAASGELLAGNIDAWLVYCLTGGQVHVTEPSNASRTLLFNIHTGEWDEELLSILDIPRHILPTVKSSSEVYGHTTSELFGAPIAIAGMAGDQQAALFGQGCFAPGSVKNTYGTGCFLLMNTGDKIIPSDSGLLTTVAWQLQGQPRQYALEGSIFVAGAVIQWLRDELQVINQAQESETLATSVPSANGVYLVPAFVGLGAPYWDSEARGTLVGLTRGSNRAHIVRAALEGIAYQVKDILGAMESDSHMPIPLLRVDGGATANNFLMQFQAELLRIPVERPVVAETTALGAAYLAGLAVGYWENLEDIQRNWQRDARFEAVRPEAEINTLYDGWQQAIRQSRAH
jgi:glycerol kinase